MYNSEKETIRSRMWKRIFALRAARAAAGLTTETSERESEPNKEIPSVESGSSTGSVKSS